jgi:hypothetical protein
MQGMLPSWWKKRKKMAMVSLASLHDRKGVGLLRLVPSWYGWKLVWVSFVIPGRQAGRQGCWVVGAQITSLVRLENVASRLGIMRGSERIT